MRKRYSPIRPGRAAVLLGAAVLLSCPISADAQMGHPTGLRGGALVPSAHTLARGTISLGAHATFTRVGTLNTALGLGSGAWGLSNYVTLYGSRSGFFSGSGASYFDYAGFQQGDAIGPIGLVYRLPRPLERPFQFAFSASVTPGIGHKSLSGHNHPYGRDTFDVQFSLLQSLRMGSVDLRLIEGYVATEADPANVPNHAVLGGGLTWWANSWLGFEAEILSRLETEAPVNITQDYLAGSGGLAVKAAPWLNIRAGYYAGFSIDRTDGPGTRAEPWMAYGSFEVLLGNRAGERPSTSRPPREEARPVPSEVKPGDADGDGVADAMDQEPDTPLGAVVDEVGRAIDTDGDGVPNGIDLQEDTPAGAVVDMQGRALDTDGDGVPDGLDMEPMTPAGMPVDARGVSLDTDNDGVPDSIDVEPNTPPGIPVDASGRGLTGMEADLLTKGLLSLNQVYFDYNSAKIKPESYATLREVGLILEKYTELKIEIGGHSDSVGSLAYNRELSQARADAVLNWLLENVEGLTLEQFTVYGYGPTMPVASNDTDEGRRLNRRVEFKVLNPQELEKYQRKPPLGQ